MSNTKEKFKIRAKSPEEIAEIQIILFKLGFNWADRSKTILYKNKKRLDIFFEVLENNFWITYDDFSDLDYFKKHKNKEVTFEKLKSKTFQTFLNKIMILKELEK